MAQNITLLGASYSDVPSVELPKTGGGTAQFDDTTIASNAASASDIANGKLAFVNGLLITGTASGGGGGGLEYESGTWTPASDIGTTTISFANTHSSAPFFYMISDASGTYSSTSSSNYLVSYFNYHQLTGSAFDVDNGTTFNYGNATSRYRSGSTTISNTTTAISYPYTYSGSTANSMSRYWATETGIKAHSTSSSRYWRAGRTYKWVAVWTPTS